MLGVKKCELKNVSNISIGEFVRKDNQIDDGEYPVYNGGISNTGFYNNFNQTENKIIISARGANAGFVNQIKHKYWAGNSCYTIDVKNNINWNYIFYFLKNNQTKLLVDQQKGSIPSISKTQVENFKITIPPLFIQQKIVEVLDKFEEISNDAQKGLQLNIEQEHKRYEYYRNKLLTFKER